MISRTTGLLQQILLDIQRLFTLKIQDQISKETSQILSTLDKVKRVVLFFMPIDTGDCFTQEVCSRVE